MSMYEQDQDQSAGETQELEAYHLGTISEFGFSGDEKLTEIINRFDFSDLYEDTPVEVISYGYIFLAEPLLLCGASVLFKVNGEYDIVTILNVDDFLENFENFLLGSVEETDQ
jgi:hypothetical protein